MLLVQTERRTQMPSDREEHITSTGFRIVGKGARDLAARLSQAPGVSPGRVEDALYAARFLIRPRLGSRTAVNEVLVVLGAAVAQRWKDAPPLTRERPLQLPAARFSGLSWDISGDPGA
jgi:hypothetical protein